MNILEELEINPTKKKKAKKRFKAKKATKISDIAELVLKGDDFFLEESDLSLQDDTYIIQFDLEKKEEKKREKYTIKPGIYNIAASQSGLFLTELEFKKQDLLKTNNNTETILGEVGKFFNNLETYTKYDIDPKRAILMYGPPGTGKTSSITEACNGLVKEDKGTVVINWNASSIRSSDVLDFFTSGSDYDEKCTRVVIVIEDIGMSVENYSGAKEVDRSLLNFLDGSGVAFRVPTFIMATTNYAHNLPENLISRPGRFDLVVEVGYPNRKDRVALLEFIMKTKLSDDDKKALESKDCDKFSAAHLKEVFIRSQLNGVGIQETIRQLKEHAKLVGKAFEKGGSLGML